jgi:predicted outer membrane protein
MNTLISRLILISALLLTLPLIPIYAHHGNQFLSKAMEMNAAEVRLGEMALNKTQNAQVKDFAEMLVRDHMEALDKVKELRDARTTTSANTDEEARRSVDIHRDIKDVPLTPQHQRLSERLSALSGTLFDREFINEMLRAHRDAISDFEAQSHAHGNGPITSNRKDSGTAGQIARQKPGPRYSEDDLSRDVDTADFAREMLPILRHHLEEAEAIQRQLQTR